MTGILAPSTIGAVWKEAGIVDVLWGVRPAEPTIKLPNNGFVLLSFKSKTVHSDGKRPTDYTRMVSRMTPGGGYRASNNVYVVKSSRGLPVGLRPGPHPYSGCDPVSGVVAVPSWMTDKVILDAIQEMSGIGGNILEDLGQLKQTAVLISDIVKVIYDLYLMCFKGNFKAVRRRLRDLGSNVPKSIANGWLMYFYGIKPLVGTIDALASHKPSIDRTISVRKRVSTGHNWRDYVNNPSGTCLFSGKAEMFAQCELTAHIRMDNVTRYWQNLGLTKSSFNDAVVTAWSLTPYSFVFDWFIPVESWLRSLVWSPALVYQGGYVGKRHRASGTITETLPFVSTGGPYTGTFPKCRLQVAYYKRITYPYVVPSAVLGIRLALNPTSIISSAALIVQKG